MRSEEHTSELQSRQYLVCRLLLDKKNTHLNSSHANISYSVYHPLLYSFPTLRSSVFFNDTATTEIYTLSLHAALPISRAAFRIFPADTQAADLRVRWFSEAGDDQLRSKPRPASARARAG